MNNKNTQFALDVPRDMIVWNEAGRSFDVVLEQGILICVPSNSAVLPEARETQNALRLWCTRYGNTIMGKFVQVVTKDDITMRKTLADIRILQPRNSNVADEETVDMPEAFDEIENTVISSEQAEALLAALADEPDIDQVVTQVLSDMEMQA